MTLNNFLKLLVLYKPRFKRLVIEPTFTGSVCTLKLFNNSFYIHILFTIFYKVSWQIIKYTYFKGLKKDSNHLLF